jgi:hypothetical protein
MGKNSRESNELIESLAALEHEQWVAWSKAVAHEVSEDRRKRWETYWVPYDELDEETKEKDREWARKVAEIIAPDNGGLNAPTTGVGPGRDITLHLDVDVSDALTGLKALRREADAAVRTLKKLDEYRDAMEELQAVPGCLSAYSTKELTDELANRAGVKKVVLASMGYAFLTSDEYGIGRLTSDEITGPARILIIKD